MIPTPCPIEACESPGFKNPTPENPTEAPIRKHPYYDCDLPKALHLARLIKYGPLPKETDPTPEAAEALEIVQQARKHARFNWITGRVAAEVLQAETGVENPYTT